MDCYQEPTGWKNICCLPPEDWFCRKFEQMNLYIIDGHVSRSGERGWLRTDQFLKVPKTQNRWYSLHPAPKFWSNDAPHLNSSYSRIAKPSGLTVTPPPSRPIAQDTLRKWDKVLREDTSAIRQRDLIDAFPNCSLIFRITLEPLRLNCLKVNPPRSLRKRSQKSGTSPPSTRT